MSFRKACLVGARLPGASQKALELATQLLGNIQNSVTDYRVRGLARTRQGDFRAALSDLEKARELSE